MLITVLIAVVLGATTLVTTTRADGGYPCCLCGPVISVELRVQNILTKPFFKESINIQMGQTQLIYFLQAAADEQKEFNFTAQYYTKMGYFITKIYNISAADGEYWEITNAYNSPLTQGVSSYVPSNNDQLTFNLTTY